MSHDVNDAQSVVLAAWYLRGFLDDSLCGPDCNNPPLTIRRADRGLLRLGRTCDGLPAMVDDQAGVVAPIDVQDVEGSILRALRNANDRVVSRLIERLHEIADTREHVGRTRRGLVLYSCVGARLCDWTAGLDGETGELVVRCEPVYGRYTSRVRGWSSSSDSGLDDWLRALAIEVEEPR